MITSVKSADGAFEGLTKAQTAYINSSIAAGKSNDQMITSLNGAKKASKAAAVGISVLETAVTALVIAFVTKTIVAFVNYEKELADQAKQATDKLHEQQKAIDDYASRIQTLYDKINSGQLTLDEHVEANRELREIQQELIDNFGDEAQGIDLVTSSLEKQKDVLEDVNNLRTSQYLQTEWENAVNKETGSQKWLNGIYTGLSWTGAIVSNDINRINELIANGGKADFREELLGYSSNLEEMNKKYDSFSAKIQSTSDDMFNHIIASYNNVRKTTSGEFEIFGNVEEVKDTIIHLQNDYKKFPGYTEEWANSLTAVWNKADDIVQKYGEMYHAQIEMNIASNEQYVAWQEQLEEIYKSYEKASIDGNKELADQYASQYKELVNQIRQSVPSKTYQEAIINVVPEIADVDYENFNSQIEGIINSDELEQFRSLDIPITLSADTSRLYSEFNRIYEKYKDVFKDDYQIKSFDNFIQVLTDGVNDASNLGASLISFLHRHNELAFTDDAYKINTNGGSFSGRYFDANDKEGTRFITNSDLEKLATYKDEIISLKDLSLDNIDDITIAFSNLTSKYGTDFTNLLSKILSTDGQLDWEDWLNDEEFNAILAQLIVSSHLTADQIKQILIGQGLIESDTRREVTNQVENFLKESFGDVELSDDDLFWQDILVKGLMNTWDEEDLNLLPFIWDYVQVPDGTVPTIDALVDVLKKYKESLEEINKEENPFSTISDSVKDYSTEIKPWLDDLGSAYDAIFNGENGFDIEVVDDDLLNNIRSQFESIQEVFAENGITDAFDTQALEDFLAVLSDDATTAEEAQAAFNAYATSLFYSADGLKNLNEETANSIKQMLQKSGVENYEKVVDNMLNYQKALEYVEEATIDLTKVDKESIATMITKGEVSVAVGQKIAFLALQEQLANANSLDTDASIDALYALAEQAGITGEYLVRLETIMQKFKAANAKYAQDVKSTNNAIHEQAKALESQAQTELNSLVSELQTELNKPVEIKIPKAADSGAGDAGKEDADEYLEAFNAELENLEWLHTNGFLTEKEYLDQLRILYQNYFSGIDKYSKEFYENQRKYLEGMLDLYNNALSAITDLLDSQEKEYEDLRDAEKKELEQAKENNEKKIKNINKEIKALDKEIKLLQKSQESIRDNDIKPLQDTIKERQKLVDSINEEVELMERANEARNDSLELQKLQYQMEKASHQKNLLVNILCQPIQ